MAEAEAARRAGPTRRHGTAARDAARSDGASLTHARRRRYAGGLVLVGRWSQPPALGCCLVI